MQQLSGQDSAFLYLETPGAHLHLTGLYVYAQPAKGPSLGFEDIRELIAAALQGMQELRRKLLRPPFDIDYPCWVDDPDFSLDHHILRYPGPAPRSRRALFQAVADIHSEPLDMNRPLWEMWVIDRLGRIPGLPPRSFAIVMKYHHAAIDGASGAMLVDRLHGMVTPDALAEPAAVPAGDHSPDTNPGTLRLAARAVLNNTAHTLSLAKYLAQALPAAGRNLKNRLLVPGSSPAVPATRFNAPVSSRRVLHAELVSLEKLRAARQQVPGATVNDVLLSVCGGALRHWLQERGELPADSLVAMVPVNARDDDETEVGGNRLSVMFLPIGSEIDDPVERLRAVRKASHRAKSTETALDPRLASAITSHVPALPLALASRLVTGLDLASHGLRLCNCTISNVPASRGELKLGPAPLVYTAGNGPLLDGMGLIISLISFDGQVNICVTSCPEMMPDPEALCREFPRQLNQLLKAS